MRPEEEFKIEDSEIPENKEELVDSSENEITDKKIDIFSKELTIEDLMEFLKKNNQIVLDSWDEQLFIDHLSYYLKYKSTLINFTDLSEEEKKRILNWRNHPDIRKWIY